MSLWSALGKAGKWLGDKAGALIGVGGEVYNAKAQLDAQKRSEAFSREMYERQRGDTLSDWNMQNAYNDPSAQMQRLKDAKLNPNLVYGNGADAQSTAPVRSSSADQPSFSAPSVNASSVMQNAMMMRQIQSNIARTDAETERIKADTFRQLYDNRFMDDDMFAQEYQTRKEGSMYKQSIQSNDAHVSDLKRETANLLGGYERSHSAHATQSTPPSANLEIERLMQSIKTDKENLKGIEFSNKMREYEANIIKNFGVSGTDAKAILSNVFKLILMYNRN